MKYVTVAYSNQAAVAYMYMRLSRKYETFGGCSEHRSKCATSQTVLVDTENVTYSISSVTIIIVDIRIVSTIHHAVVYKYASYP